MNSEIRFLEKSFKLSVFCFHVLLAWRSEVNGGSSGKTIVVQRDKIIRGGEGVRGHSGNTGREGVLVDVFGIAKGDETSSNGSGETEGNIK